MERHDCTGAEAAFLGVTGPTGAYGIGFTPKLIYTFSSFGRLKPYIEGGGGPLWTNFDGRIREQGSDFNFLVWGGAGVSYDLIRQWALTAGVRFSHISNSGLDTPNSGLNYLLPFAGVSTKLFDDVRVLHDGNCVHRLQQLEALNLC